jgi:hypothetical protein
LEKEKEIRQTMEEEQLADVPVCIGGMTPEATRAMFDYFEKHPPARQHEARASGQDPLKDPLAYWRNELREIEHDSVRRSVNCTGVMTLADFYEWAAVNRREYEQGRWQEEQCATPTEMAEKLRKQIAHKQLQLSQLLQPCSK